MTSEETFEMRRRGSKIQDRLAQRAPRQRLRQAQLDTRPSTAQLRHTPHPASSRNDASPETSIEDSPNALALLDTFCLLLSPPGSLDDPFVEDSSPETGILDLNLTHIPYPKSYAAPSPLIQISIPYKVLSALYTNGEIQGIPCAISCSSRTPMPKPHIPLPLHPTELQQMIVQPQWFDRLSFPRMRDSLIRLRGVADEEELYKGIFTMPSFTIEVECACWDPSGWRMEREWEKKRGRLMF